MNDPSGCLPGEDYYNALPESPYSRGDSFRAAIQWAVHLEHVILKNEGCIEAAKRVGAIVDLLRKESSSYFDGKNKKQREREKRIEKGMLLMKEAEEE